MKILQVIPTLSIGGAERFVVELSNELAKTEKCDVLTLFDESGGDDLYDSLSQDVRRFTIHKKKGFDISCFFKLLKFVKSGNYDVIHGHVAAIKYLVLASLFFRDKRFVATIHSEASREAGNPIDKWSRKFMFARGLCTPVTISERSEESFRRFYGYDAPIIYNGSSPYERDCDLRIRDNDSQLVFVHPASCRPVKNQTLLFEAFKRLIERYPNTKLIWIGANVSSEGFLADIKSQMIPQIEYLGIVYNVRDYLAAADAMCLSSKMEGMPMAIIEAFSVGCIPICTPVGGIVNMIKDNENGFLSKSLSADDYYEAMVRFCETNPEQRAEVRSNVLHSFNKYSIRNCSEKYLDIYVSRT